ncbi:hypothetical protein V8E53_015335 [Lactarius tabidus]
MASDTSSLSSRRGYDNNAKSNRSSGHTRSSSSSLWTSTRLSLLTRIRSSIPVSMSFPSTITYTEPPTMSRKLPTPLSQSRSTVWCPESVDSSSQLEKKECDKQGQREVEARRPGKFIPYDLSFSTMSRTCLLSAPHRAQLSTTTTSKSGNHPSPGILTISAAVKSLYEMLSATRLILHSDTDSRKETYPFVPCLLVNLLKIRSSP